MQSNYEFILKGLSDNESELDYWRRTLQKCKADSGRLAAEKQEKILEEMLQYINKAKCFADEFWETASHILQYIDDNHIINIFGMHDMSRIILVLSKKYSKSPGFRKISHENGSKWYHKISVRGNSVNGDIEISYDNTIVGLASYQSVVLHFVNIIKKKDRYVLIIEGESSVPACFAEKDARVFVSINGKVKKTKWLGRSVDKMILGEKYEYCKIFRASISLKTNREYNIQFFNRLQNINVFYRAIVCMRFAPVSAEVEQGYAISNGFVVKLVGQNQGIFDTLFVKSITSNKEVVDYEKNYCAALRSLGLPEGKYAALFREYYFYFKRKKTKIIWLFMDRIDKADDNAEALFCYIQQLKPSGIQTYFIIDYQAEDFQRLKHLGNVVKANSAKHRMLHLLADVIISSQCNGIVENPFFDEAMYYRDLYHQAKLIFLQHGVIKDDMSNTLNRFNTNFTAFVTSSWSERLSIIGGAYQYNEEEIWLTGLPRFDLLYNNRQKYIIIMPSWRMGLMHQVWSETTGSMEWKVTPDFFNSDFVKRYKSLINNTKLLNACRAYGYQLVFMPHVLMEPYIEYFIEPNNCLFWGKDYSYRKAFAEGNLLITDYSSVAFDFAYLKKPILYYQFDKDDFFSNHTYEKGYFEYEKDGFGEVCYSEHEIISFIIAYIQGGCVVKECYKKRMEGVFQYHDNNNCKRLYERIKTLSIE